MYIVIFFSILAFLLTYLESKGKMKGGMKIGFILVTILGAIHYDYGNDYFSYLGNYEEITRYSFDLLGILAGEYYREPGWALLCWLFKPIGGFFRMVAVLNIIQNYIVYRFINTNVEVEWWGMAIFTYLFVQSYYLMSFTMMRQEFVVIVFLGLWTFIKERKWWISLLVLYLCSFIHSSSLILLPFAFWGFVSMKNAKIIGVGYVIFLATLWIFQDTLNNIFQFALTLDEGFSNYANNYDDGKRGLNIGLGFIVSMIPFVLSILFLFSKNNQASLQIKQMVALSAISFLIAPFSQIIQLVGRLSVYFGVYSIGAIPFIYSNIKDKSVRICFIGLYIIVILYSYYLFFTTGIYSVPYSEFHTIFSVL